jgi:hypothetical protein
MLICYLLPPDGTKNQVFIPDGHPKPEQQPKNRKKPASHEDKTLRGMSPQIGAYLDFLKKQKGIQMNRFMRALYRLSQKMTTALFISTIERSLKYRITDIDTIERIAVLLMNNTNYDIPFTPIDVDLESRESYLEGCFTDQVNLSAYDQEDENG